MGLFCDSVVDVTSNKLYVKKIGRTYEEKNFSNIT